jgi:hypothetical protein
MVFLVTLPESVMVSSRKENNFDVKETFPLYTPP